MKEKLRTTSFWLSIGSAIMIIITCFTDLFGLEVCAEHIENVIISICSVLVMLGVITKKNVSENDSSKKDLISDIENFNTDK